MNHRMRLDENQVATPPAKGKAGPASSRYQPASQYDDATLAQKREYWRNKKREQRARLAKRRGKATLEGRDRKPQHSFCPEEVTVTVSASPGASSLHPRRDEAYVPQCRNTILKSSHGATDTQKGEWLEKTEVSEVFPSVPAEAAEKATVRPSAARVSKAVPSPLAGGSQRNAGPSVPAVRVMGVNNGCSRPSLHDRSVSQTPCRPQAALPDTRISSPYGPSCEESQPKATHPTPQLEAKAPTLSEEEKAAKRREQWRIKKREQRAKTAAQRARQKTRLTGRSEPHPPGPILRSFSSVRLQSAAVAITNTQKSQMNVPHMRGNKTSLTNFPFSAPTGKKRLNHAFHSNVTRGSVRCKTPRQGSIEVQKNLTPQRNLRCKSLPAASGTKNSPRIDPSDTPETVVAKRREYWRVKKREQRAKLTMEMKMRLREKDSLMRRVKRYQQILNDMRRARAAAGSTGVRGSEAIGGFIGKDGTLAVGVPQSPKGRHTAGHQSEEEHHNVSKNSPIITQLQSKQRSFAPVEVHQPSPPLPPSSASSTPALQAVRSSPRPKTTTVPSSQSGGRLKVWAPPPCRDPSSGPNLGRCAARAAVTWRFSYADSGVSEEMRVARKREYWRTKKREQRAALAARLKLGLSAALKRRKAQRQEAAAPTQLGRGLSHGARGGLPRHSNAPPIAPRADDIKQEGESDPNPQPEPAICPDTKPPAPPFAPPGSQQELDPSQCADSQAATLLAVASMKKLLEESLSSVSDVKTEAVEGDSEPNPQPDFQRDSISPISADVAMLLNDWQPDDEAVEKKPNLQTSSQMNETGLFLPLSEEKYPAQSPSDFTHSFGASGDRILPCQVQGLCSKNGGRETFCSIEPPKLHHITQECLHQQEPEGDTRRPAPETWQGTFAPSQQPSRAGTEQLGSSSLQKKREYWKLMKRQQRARLKERRREDGSSLLLTGSIRIKQILQSDLPASSGAEGPRAPPLLLVSQSTSNTQRSSDTLHVKLPAACRVEKTTTTHRVLEPQWIPRTNEVTCVPPPPALKPPDNPLSSLNLQLFESHAQSPASSITSPRKVPRGHPQVPNSRAESSIKSAPLCTVLPPKLLPGESEKDFTKRKREYWRVKKKEQRAKKAIQKRGLSPRIGPSSWSPSFHPPDLQPGAGPAQGCGQWGIPSDGPDDFQSHLGQWTAQRRGEDLDEYLDNEEEEEEEALSGPVWRRHYLMDYDPLNQLLVCMVCGELQYSHSPEGVRAHIEETHPHSMTLEPLEKQRILEAWDEQVSRRELFFSRQLQQNSRDPAGMQSKRNI